MNSLVVYDSQFGNTKKVAQAIAGGLEAGGETKLVHVQDAAEVSLAGIDLLIVGSPTQQLSATGAVKSWLDSLPSRSLVGIRAAAFDTRFTEEKINEIRVLAFFVSIFGYGAKPISRRLAKKGATIILDPEGFYVADTEGPLLDRELDRAREWAAQILRDEVL